MRVHIGGDHAAYDLLGELVTFLEAEGHEVTNHGPHALDPEDDYPVFVLRAAQAVAADPESLGVVLGGSGNGEQMAANKVAGIRAALCSQQRAGQPGPRAQQRPGHLDRGRMNTVDEAKAMVRGLPRDPVLRRRAARAPDRHGHARTRPTGRCRRPPPDGARPACGSASSAVLRDADP